MAKNSWLQSSWATGVNLLLLFCLMDTVSNYSLNVYRYVHRLVTVYKVFFFVCAVNSVWPRNSLLNTYRAPGPIIYIYIMMSAPSQRTTVEKGVETLYEHRVGYKWGKTVSYRCERTAILIIWQQLWVSVQDLYKIKPVNILAWRSERLTSLCLWGVLNKWWFLRTKVSFFFKGTVLDRSATFQ